MTAAVRKEKRVPVSPKLQALWTALRVALNTAAQPITGKPFVIGPMTAHDLPGADREMEAALKTVPQTNVHAQFVQEWPAPDGGTLSILLEWVQTA